MNEIFLDCRPADMMSPATIAALGDLPIPEEAQTGQAISVGRDFLVAENGHTKPGFSFRIYLRGGSACKRARISEVPAPFAAEAALPALHFISDSLVTHFGLNGIEDYAHRMENFGTWFMAGFPGGCVIYSDAPLADLVDIPIEDERARHAALGGSMAAFHCPGLDAEGLGDLVARMEGWLRLMVRGPFSHIQAPKEWTLPVIRVIPAGEAVAGARNG